MTKHLRRYVVILTALVASILGISTVSLADTIIPFTPQSNSASFWVNYGPHHGAQCYKHEANGQGKSSSDHGSSSGSKVTLAPYGASWFGDHYELLVIKAGTYNNVIVHPSAGVAYTAPQGKTVSHWIVCKGVTPPVVTTPPTTPPTEPTVPPTEPTTPPTEATVPPETTPTVPETTPTTPETVPPEVTTTTAPEVVVVTTEPPTTTAPPVVTEAPTVPEVPVVIVASDYPPQPPVTDAPPAPVPAEVPAFVPAPVAATPTALPSTGKNTANLVQIAAVVLLAGVATLLVARRRRSI